MAEKRKMTAKQKKMLVWGGVAAAAYFLFTRGAAAAGAGPVVLEPAKVGANELVSVQSGRLIQERREGMQYVPTSSGVPGAEISFTSPVSGMFTRNFINEGGEVLAEIKA